MTFKKGDPKPSNSGRKRGTPNKVRVLRVAEVLAGNKINPVQEIISLLPNLEPRERVKTLLELISYLEVKPSIYEPIEDHEEETQPAEAATTADLLSLVTPK